MLTPDQIISFLNDQGTLFSSNPELIYIPREQVKATADQMFTLLNNTNSIEVPTVITGLLMNISSFIVPGIPVNTVNQIWLDLENVIQHVSNYVDIYAINEILRTLIILCGSVNPHFLDFLADPSFSLDPIRSYILETLYFYLPVGYLTSNDGRKRFLAESMINSLGVGDIYHRSFIIQIFYAMKLTVDQICTLENFPTAFWTVIFNISLEKDDFVKLLRPVNKLKSTCYALFEKENPMIFDILTDFDNRIQNSNDFLPVMLNLFKVFHLFPTNCIINFLQLAFNTFSKFSGEDWNEIKSISHLLDECILEAKFGSNQVDIIYDFSSKLPSCSAKYFIFVHFFEIFNKFENFVHPFIMNLCDGWMKSDTFNPVIFCFCVSKIAYHLSDVKELVEALIIPSLFNFIENKESTLLNYVSLKALKHLYREDLIKAENFCNTLLEMTVRANHITLKYFFKFISEIKDHTSKNDDSSDDEYTEEEEEEEVVKRKLINRQIYDKIENFVRSNVVSNDIDPFLRSYLCDSLIYFLYKNEDNEFIQQCLLVCHQLISDPISIQYPIILTNATQLYLELLRTVKKNFNDQYYQLFHPLYIQILNIVKNYNFNSENTDNNDKIGCTSFLLLSASFCIKNNNYPFEYPADIVLKLLNTDSIYLIEFGLSNAKKLLTSIYIKEKGQINQLFIDILDKVVFHCGMSKNIYIVNSTYSVFNKLLEKIEIDKLNPLFQYFEKMKNYGFQERYKILNGQCLTKLESRYKHFKFFEFVNLLVKNSFQLTSMEIFTLIRWIENSSANLLVDILDILMTVLRKGQFAKDNNLLDPLWTSLNNKLIELNPAFSKKPEPVISLFNTFIELLTYMNFCNLGTFDSSSLFLRLRYAWKSDPMEIGPIILRIYRLTNNILEFDYSILNSIGDTVIEQDCDWDFPQIVDDIISMHFKLSGLHLFKYTAAEVLFKFYIQRNYMDGDTPYLAKLGFEEKLIEEMGNALIDMYIKDSRIIDYLRTNDAYDDYQIIDTFKLPEDFFKELPQRITKEDRQINIF